MPIVNPDNPLYIPAKYFHKGRLKPVELIVIHTMEAPEKPSTAEAVANYFTNPERTASAHYCIDNNSIVQCVYDSNTAFACKNANANGVHLEHAGYANQQNNDWLDDYGKQMLDISAQVCSYLCQKFNIPVQMAKFRSKDDPTVALKGICGHADVPLHGSHTDPGFNFPYEYYFELVKKYMN